MAWDDPSPRARAASARPAAQPGYGAEPASFGRLVFALAAAGIAGVSTALATRHGLAAWQGHAARATVFDIVLSAAIGVAVAVFAWRYLMNRRGGGGWISRFGPWGSLRDRYGDSPLRTVIAAEAVVDVVGDVIDAALD